MKKLIRDERGNTGIIFIVGMVIAVFVWFTHIEVYKLTHYNSKLDVVQEKALSQMQIAGGINQGIEDGIIDFLKDNGFEEANIVVTGTPGPKEWGEEVGLTILYRTTIREYKYKGILNIEAVDKEYNFSKESSTISYFFDNNGG